MEKSKDIVIKESDSISTIMKTINGKDVIIVSFPNRDISLTVDPVKVSWNFTKTLQNVIVIEDRGKNPDDNCYHFRGTTKRLRLIHDAIQGNLQGRDAAYPEINSSTSFG